MRRVVLLVLVSGCLDEELGTERNGVIGDVTADYPAVGQLLIGETQEVAGAKCTGTLIGCTTFLTAAHCVCPDDDPGCDTEADPGWANAQVFFQHAGFIPVTAIDTSGVNDVAVLTLARPVTGIEPVGVPIEVPPAGTVGVAIGYGRLGGSDFERGIKRSAPVGVECTGAYCSLSGPASLCNGDSGGPTLLVAGDGASVIGVHSTTSAVGCIDPDNAGSDAATTADLDFITGAIDPTTCLDPGFPGPPTVTTETGRLEPGESVEIDLEVPPGTAELRVALNSTDLVIPEGEEGHGIRLGPDLDLALEPVEALELPAACTAAGSSPAGYCELLSPSPGSYRLRVSAKSEGVDQGGDFQLTTTLFAGAPIASGESYEVGGDRPLAVDAAGGLLVNDTDAGPMSALVVTPPGHGEVAIAADGSFTYTPAIGYRGPDSFSYRATDGTYQSAPVTVELMVFLTAEENHATGGCSAGGGADLALGFLLLGLSARRARSGRRRREARPSRRCRRRG